MGETAHIEAKADSSPRRSRFDPAATSRIEANLDPHPLGSAQDGVGLFGQLAEDLMQLGHLLAQVLVAPRQGLEGQPDGLVGITDTPPGGTSRTWPGDRQVWRAATHVAPRER